MMRIITGAARGTKLYTLEGEDTRPTTERTKEAIFSMIQFDIEGRRVLDLYAGSGQLGLEALSRGADFCMFIDANPAAMDIVKKNIEKTHMGDKSKTLISDARNYLRKIKGGEKYQLVFIDPPYKDSIVPDVLDKLAKYDIVSAGGIIVCESEEELNIEADAELSRHYTVKRQTGYGKKVHITLLEKKDIENEG